jgi:predicted ATPase
VARDRQERYASGAAFVDLASLGDASLLARSIAESLGLRLPPGRDARTPLIDWLSRHQVLLVLDNAEHVVQAVAELTADVLHRCPGVQLIVTSREALLTPGETTVGVNPLGLPEAEGEGDPTRLLESDAARLFVERASEARPGFAVTPENARDIVEICRRLDGIPLALELAAARARTLGIHQIAERLNDRFRLLTAGPRTVLPRQQTLRATLEWSHDLLSEEERVAFRRLAVFAGGWTLEAAEAVIPDDALMPADVMDLLDRLVLKSLVMTEGDPARTALPAAPRYRFLESIREHASERLAAAADRDATSRRHRDWCQRFAIAVSAELGGKRQADSLDRLELEHANLLAALEQAHADPDGGAQELQLAGSLVTFWSTRGYVSKGRGLIERSLAASAGPPSVDRVRAYLGAGHLARMDADFAASERNYAQGLALARTLGERLLEGRALTGLGAACLHRSDFRRAEEYFVAARALLLEAGETEGLAQLLNNLADIALERGEHDRAAGLYEESRVTAASLGDVRQQAVAIYNLGYLAITRGHTEEAIRRLDESIVQFRRLGHRQGIAMATMSLGKAWLDCGEASRGEALLREGLVLADRLGDRMVRGYSLLYSGEAAVVRGTVAEGRERLLGSLATFSDMGSPNDVCDVLERFVRLLLLQDRAGDAATLLGAVDHLRVEVGHPLNPSERESHAALIRDLRTRFVDSAFTAAHASGAAMTLEAAAEFARAAVGERA